MDSGIYATGAREARNSTRGEVGRPREKELPAGGRMLTLSPSLSEREGVVCPKSSAGPRRFRSLVLGIELESCWTRDYDLDGSDFNQSFRSRAPHAQWF